MATAVRVPTITEKAFSQQVVQLARLYGWLVYRTWSSLHSPAGFPDLCMARGPRLLFAELKVGRNTLSVHQERWRDALHAAGQEWRLWTPADMDEIARELGEG